MAEREAQIRDARLEVVVETGYRRWQIFGVGRHDIVAQQARQRRRAAGWPKNALPKRGSAFFLTRLDLVASRVRAQQPTLGNRSTGRLIAAFPCPSRPPLVAGEAVRVPGLGSFDVAARPAREGRNPQTGEAIPQRGSKPPLAARLGHCARTLPDPQRDWGIFYRKAARAVAFAATIYTHNPAFSTA